MSDHVDDPTELDLVYNDLWNAKARIEALEAALREIMEEPYHDVASIARYALAGGGVLEKARAALEPEQEK